MNGYSLIVSYSLIPKSHPDKNISLRYGSTINFGLLGWF